MNSETKTTKHSVRTAFHRQGDWEAFYDAPVEINWVVTHMCNYHCSYCFGQDKLDKTKFSTWPQLQNAIKHIAAMHRPWYNITLTGGEPTAHPHFFDLLEGLALTLGERLNHILIISNGSRNGELYQKIAKLAETSRINMNISIHTDHAKLDHIIELTSLLGNRLCINFSLMYNPAKWSYVKEIYSTLCELRNKIPFNLEIKTLREPPKFDRVDSRYKEEHFLWQEDATNKFNEIARQALVQPPWRGKYPASLFWESFSEDCIKCISAPTQNQQLRKNFHNFKDMYCAMATRIVGIEPDGQCLGARCRIATKTKLNIFSETPYKDPDFVAAVKCTEQNCGCSTNHPIPKFADKEEAEHFMRIFRTKQRRLMDEYQEKQMLLSRIEEGGAANDDVQPKTLLSCESSNPSLQFKRPLFEQGSEFAIRSVIAKSSLFDSEYYLAQYPDVALADMDPIFHYVRYGANEGRNPSPKFSTELYLKANPDVAGAGINSLYQYLISGKAKDREAFPCPQ